MLYYKFFIIISFAHSVILSIFSTMCQFSLAVRVGHKICEVFLFLPLRCLESHMRDSYIIIYNLHTHAQLQTPAMEDQIGFSLQGNASSKILSLSQMFFMLSDHLSIQYASRILIYHTYFSLTQKKREWTDVNINFSSISRVQCAILMTLARNLKMLPNFLQHFNYLIF